MLPSSAPGGGSSLFPSSGRRLDHSQPFVDRSGQTQLYDFLQIPGQSLYSDLSFWQHPKKKDFGKERKNAWVGGSLAQAEGRDAKYYASCFYIRKRCVVCQLRLEDHQPISLPPLGEGVGEADG